jgi:hypothetical protein
MMTDAPFGQREDAILRHIAWAERFMAVGDFVGVIEELGDATALAAEMVNETLPAPAQ